jgi:SAM-dependent methyltransferase
MHNLPTAHSPRACPACNNTGKRLLFRQTFGTFSEGNLMAGFNLVVCTHCGMGYANDIPMQDAFDRYYAGMSKYEYSNRAGVQTETYLHQFRETADLVAPHLKTGYRLLDIGCATGGLLAEFKKRGFTKLLGVDPSPTCARLTEQLYGIPGKALTISMLNQLGEKFDAVFLTGVLEHLRDIDASLNSIKACLCQGGFVYFEVPDATRYDRHFSAPFQFFSMEHVNYFSPVSLGNLLARHGFSAVFTQRLIRRLSPQAIEPCVGALFRWDSTEQRYPKPVFDEETEPALNRYIRQSRTLEQKIQETISALADSAKPLAIWGVGTHTLRLLETSRLPQARIVSFIDSNIHYQGKHLQDIPIVSPDQFNRPDAVILISSQAAEQEIKNLIQNKLKWPNKIVCLYENASIPSPA